MRREFPWIKLCFVNPGATAFSQPLDRNIMRPFKCALQKAATALLAAIVVNTLDDEGGLNANMSAPTLRPLMPLWVAAAVRSIEGSPPFVREGLGVRD